jgi:hypothetical protein
MSSHEQPYKCVESSCDKRLGFSDLRELLRHESDVHQKDRCTKKASYCPYPNSNQSTSPPFARQDEFIEHLRRRHDHGGEMVFPGVQRLMATSEAQSPSKEQRSPQSPAIERDKSSDLSPRPCHNAIYTEPLPTQPSVSLDRERAGKEAAAQTTPATLEDDPTHDYSIATDLSQHERQNHGAGPQQETTCSFSITSPSPPASTQAWSDRSEAKPLSDVERVLKSSVCSRFCFLIEISILTRILEND